MQKCSKKLRRAGVQGHWVRLVPVQPSDVPNAEGIAPGNSAPGSSAPGGEAEGRRAAARQASAARRVTMRVHNDYEPPNWDLMKSRFMRALDSIEISW